MEYLPIDFCETVGDIVAFFLCVVVILFMIRNRTNKNRNDLAERPDGHFGNLNDVLTQLVRQSEMAFATISDTIKMERVLLRELIQKGEIRKRAQISRNMCIADSADNQYREIVRLANLGLSVNEISKRVKTSEGEIELITKLRKGSSVPLKKARPAIRALSRLNVKRFRLGL